jgi:hypothetical protein
LLVIQQPILIEPDHAIALIDQIERAFTIPGPPCNAQLTNRQPDGCQTSIEFLAEFIYFGIHVECTYRLPPFVSQAKIKNIGSAQSRREPGNEIFSLYLVS